MIDRQKYFPIVTILVTLLVMSTGINIILINKLTRLISDVNINNPPVSKNELNNFIEETNRLSIEKYTNNIDNNRYDIKTKQPITNEFKIDQ